MPIQSATESNWIAFPNLDWKFNLDDSINLFGLNIKFYGLLIAIGFSLAILYGVKRAKHFGIDPDRMIDVALIVTPLAFIGARLYYVFFSANLSEYLADPITILMVWKGGLGIYGGVITAFGVGILACKLCKVNLWAMFDVTALGFLIGQCIGRWGNFFNQEAFGGNTDLPWGMTGNLIGHPGMPHGSGYDPTGLVHPTFLYESLWCLLGFILLHILSKKCYKFKGQIFCGYAVWYGTGRFLIESLRTDSLMVGPFRVSQLVALAAVAGGVALFFILRHLSHTKVYLMVTTPLQAAGNTPIEVTEQTPISEEESYDEHY